MPVSDRTTMNKEPGFLPLLNGFLFDLGAFMYLQIIEASAYGKNTGNQNKL